MRKERKPMPAEIVAAALLLAAAAGVHALDNGFVRPPLGWSALYGAPFSTVSDHRWPLE